jgi:EAL domain-containing protein (putative c-di-GMP-specific phosphodiesterase class I)
MSSDVTASLAVPPRLRRRAKPITTRPARRRSRTTRSTTTPGCRKLLSIEPTPHDSSVRASAADATPEPDERAVRDLLDSGGPSIVYQPTLHIETGRVIGAEALSRFPGAGPRQWFAAAEAAGIGPQLEIAAARKALTITDGPTRERLGWDFVGVNLSPSTLLDPLYLDLLDRRIGRFVVLELSDDGGEAGWSQVRGVLERVRDLGGRIALNALKFDTHGQLTRLVEFAPDIVKLDVTYTSALMAPGGERGLAEQLLLECTRGGMFVVGVGVERQSQLDVLRELGVDAAQGYAIGRPQAIENFASGAGGVGDELGYLRP